MSGRSKKQQVRKVKPDETIMEEPHESVVDAPAFPEDLDTHGEIVHEIGHQEMGGPVESLEEHHGVVEEPAETDTSTTKKKSKRRKPAYQFFVAVRLVQAPQSMSLVKEARQRTKLCLQKHPY
jgi:hypothetical protein